MHESKLLRVVLDTNIVFEGLTKRDGTCGLIIDAWFAGIIQVCISNALRYEYMDVLSRKLSPEKWQKSMPLLAFLMTNVKFIEIHFTWRPTSPDPADDFVIDCAMNANAIVVTANRRDFRKAELNLGLQVMTPVEFLAFLAR